MLTTMLSYEFTVVRISDYRRRPAPADPDWTIGTGCRCPRVYVYSVVLFLDAIAGVNKVKLYAGDVPYRVYVYYGKGNSCKDDISSVARGCLLYGDVPCCRSREGRRVPVPF